MPRAAIDAIEQRQEPVLASEVQRLVYQFARALVVDRVVPSPVFDAARAAIGDVGVVDLVGLIGCYPYIAMTIVAFEVPIPDEDEPPNS